MTFEPDPGHSVRMTSDPLQTLCQFYSAQKKIGEKDDLIIFGHLAWAKNTKTNYKIYGFVGEYYTIGCLVNFLKNMDVEHSTYVSQSTDQKIPVVEKEDREELLKYLRGESQASSSIDHSAPPPQSPTIFNQAQDFDDSDNNIFLNSDRNGVVGQGKNRSIELPVNEENEKNCFKIEKVLTLLMKGLSIRDLKKYRFVNHQWNNAVMNEIEKSAWTQMEPIQIDEDLERFLDTMENSNYQDSFCSFEFKYFGENSYEERLFYELKLKPKYLNLCPCNNPNNINDDVDEEGIQDTDIYGVEFIKILKFFGCTLKILKFEKNENSPWNFELSWGYKWHAIEQFTFPELEVISIDFQTILASYVDYNKVEGLIKLFQIITKNSPKFETLDFAYYDSTSTSLNNISLLLYDVKQLKSLKIQNSLLSIHSAGLFKMAFEGMRLQSLSMTLELKRKKNETWFTFLEKIQDLNIFFKSQSKSIEDLDLNLSIEYPNYIISNTLKCLNVNFPTFEKLKRLKFNCKYSGFNLEKKESLPFCNTYLKFSVDLMLFPSLEKFDLIIKSLNEEEYQISWDSVVTGICPNVVNLSIPLDCILPIPVGCEKSHFEKCFPNVRILEINYFKLCTDLQKIIMNLPTPEELPWNSTLIKLTLKLTLEQFHLIQNPILQSIRGFKNLHHLELICTDQGPEETEAKLLIKLFKFLKLKSLKILNFMVTKEVLAELRRCYPVNYHFSEDA